LRRGAFTVVFFLRADRDPGRSFIFAD